MPHVADEIASGSAVLKTEKSRHFDESYAYRLMEGLRSQITYGGHAVHIVTFSTSVEDPTKSDSVINYVTPTIMVSHARLVEDGKVKQTLLDEIRQREPNEDFVPMLCEYIGRLSEVHDFFRNLCLPKVDSSIHLFDTIFAQFRETYPETADFNGLVAREYHGETVSKEFWIVANPQRLDDFRAKNKVLRNLERSRVMNSIPKP